MYNPFSLLNERLLQDKIEAGKRYFVRQTYKRGLNKGLTAAFLFRAYEEDEKELADKHMATLKNDGNAFLYDAKNKVHLEKLQAAAKQPFGFKIFYAGKKGLDWKPPVDYQNKVRQYIRRYHPGWRTKPGGDKIQVGLFEEFGQLFLKFNYEDEEDKIPLEVIEQY